MFSSSVNQVSSNNNHIYTPPGYNNSPSPRPHSATLPAGYSTTPTRGSGGGGDSSPVVATGGRIIQEVPINEPDLNRKPVRSALKGGKNKEMFQRQLADKLKERQLQQQLSLELAPGGDTAGSESGSSRPSTLPRSSAGPPITAPKPKG